MALKPCPWLRGMLKAHAGHVWSQQGVEMNLGFTT